MSTDAQQPDSVPTTYQRLAARFAPGEHKTKTIGGTGLTYVDGETVISRLNDVLGYDGWSFEVGQVNVLEKEVWATGTLTVYVGDRRIVRQQAGGQIINRTRAGEIIELSNDIKGAITDCLKKCATLVGVGLYLYDPDERREVAAEMAAAKRGNAAPKAPAATPAASPGTKANPSASTPTASPAAPTSSSTPATPAVDAAAVLTGATPINQQARWQRLVAEAERVNLPTLGQVKAIDPKAVSEPQLKRYADRLEERLYEVREATGAA